MLYSGGEMAREITKASYKVLELLKNNQNGYMTPSDLCYALNKKPASVSNLLSRLKDKKYVELQEVGSIHNYTLTSLGKEILNGYLNRVIAQSQKPNLNTEALYTRLHALAIGIPFKNKLSASERADLVASLSPKPLKLKNHIDYIFQFSDLTFKLTSRALIAYAKQAVARIDEPIPQLTEQAIQDTINVVYALEMQLNAKNGYFKLKRKTKTIENQKDYDYTLIELHIAITNDILAKEATAISDPYIIAMSEVDSEKVGMLADKSEGIGSGNDRKGIPEVEGVSHAKLKNNQPEAVFNMENVRRYYQLLGQGKYDPEYEQQLLRQTLAGLNEVGASLSEVAQAQVQQANNMNYYGERLSAHALAIERLNTTSEKLNKVLDKLDRLLSQRRLNDYKVD